MGPEWLTVLARAGAGTGWGRGRGRSVQAGGVERGVSARAAVAGTARQVAGRLVMAVSGRQVPGLILRGTGLPQPAGTRRPAHAVRPGGRGVEARVLSALLEDVADLGAGCHQLVDPAVDLPVAQALGQVAIVAKEADVQPVAEVVENHAALAAEGADWPGLPEGLDVVQAQLLAPVAGRGLEAELFRWRAGSEEHDVVLGRAHAGLERRSPVGSHQPVAHSSDPSAGRSHTWPS